MIFYFMFVSLSFAAYVAYKKFGRKFYRHVGQWKYIRGTVSKSRPSTPPLPLEEVTNSPFFLFFFTPHTLKNLDVSVDINLEVQSVY